METEVQTSFRVTVWEPYFSKRMILHVDQPSSVKLYGREHELQHEVFTCEIAEDVWGGITDDTSREQLQRGFLGAFEASQPPSSRSMVHLGAYLNLVDLAIRSGHSSWSQSQSQISDIGAAPVLADTLYAFHQQLSWIYETFRDVPGATVSVR
ncbi:hypothetical protein [Neoroseomonas oryzicola]|uniref:Uncharacterized protein n=1 Tax=Neoroseomonas oryzicola TaxID=535904 RepID=A0A9X9WLH7_9PROT|nr:hypothetical protein [Neoroseomonas oryzicola]MBR0661187.1 hypothetical protein [Neoroseomonas oryzicola]NKE17552.1 hypothetical protein [Neoroseomonas oryzicola]